MRRSNRVRVACLFASSAAVLTLAVSVDGAIAAPADGEKEIGSTEGDPGEVPPSAAAARSAPVVFEGFVFDHGGAPADGALVVTSAGGRAVANPEGFYRLETLVPLAAQRVQVTAVGRSTRKNLATRTVGLSASSGHVVVGTLSLSQGGTCPPEWLPTFNLVPWTNQRIWALAVYDDGGGPALYVGGEFTIAGATPADFIAKWDGRRWSALGGDVGNRVRALAVYDDGNGPALYAGGDFRFGVLKWEGSSWSPLGIPNTMGDVYALTVHDDGRGPALFVGGRFTNASTVAANRIARWDGSSWSALGSGMNSPVRTLAVYDDRSGPALYAGGDFVTAGGVTANRVAKWDGTRWLALGSGIDAPVHALAVHDDGSGPALFIGGEFTTAGGMEVNHIVKWDGRITWSALGNGTSGFVHALGVYDDGGGTALYAGDGSSGVRVWNGSYWSDVGKELDSGGIAYAMTVHDDGHGPALFVGGFLGFVGGATKIARWDGTYWRTLGGGLNDDVRALSVFDDGSGSALYAAGDLTTAGGVPVNRIAKWDGTRWSALGSGMQGGPSQVFALITYDDGSGPALYAGGDFETAGGMEASAVARWSRSLPELATPQQITSSARAGRPHGMSGSRWSPVGSGMSGSGSEVRALAAYDDGSGPSLYAGGSFTTAGRVTVNNVSRWNGTHWSALGSGVSNTVNALVEHDDGGGRALYAGGRFFSAGGVEARKIAKWDGTSWSPLGSGMNDDVYALAVFDDGGGPALYAGGFFRTAGGMPANRIARWDGMSWSPLGSGMDSVVRALAVHDAGGGPALYAAGSFTTAGGVAVNRIARWDGSSWSALEGGVNPLGLGGLWTLEVHDDGGGAALFAGGSFWSYIDSGDSFLAKWGPPDDVTPPQLACPADFTVDATFARAGGGTPSKRVTFSVSATDACDSSPVVVCSPPSGSELPLGTTTVACTAEDAAGNLATCSFDVTVRSRKPGGLGGPPGDAVVPETAGAPGGLPGAPFGRVEQSPSDPPSDPSSRRAMAPPLAQLHRGGTLRNGSDVNPLLLVSASEPRPGRLWTALVDLSEHPTARGSILLLSDRPLTGAPAPFPGQGELLVDLSGPHLLATSTVPSGRGQHAHAIPLEPRAALLGRSLHAQALILDEVPVLTNAVDLVVGR